jgi:hypothetical protein
MSVRSSDAQIAERWDTVRYRWLLPRTARGGARASLYAALCAHVVWRLDVPRRLAAVARIARWLDVSDADADDVYRAALRSEAREEADSCWLMSSGTLPATCTVGAEPDCAMPAIWATLHFGSPVLAYLHLRRLRGLDVQIVGRPLDDQNPMPAVKRAWGVRKVAWVESVGGLPILGVSPQATALAHQRLLRGRSVFVLMDVPGDVVARRMTVSLFGERISLAAGIFALAAMARVPVIPVAVVRRGVAFDMHYGEPLHVGARGAVSSDDVAQRLASFVLPMPHEWWLWPYLPKAA